MVPLPSPLGTIANVMQCNYVVPRDERIQLNIRPMLANNSIESNNIFTLSWLCEKVNGVAETAIKLNSVYVAGYMKCQKIDLFVRDERHVQ